MDEINFSFQVHEEFEERRRKKHREADYACQRRWKIENNVNVCVECRISINFIIQA